MKYYVVLDTNVVVSALFNISSYNIVMVEGAAASRVFFHLKAEAVRMGE